VTSVYNLLREACGISQTDAAEQVHGTRLDTVKSWCSDRRPAPQWAINDLQSLARRIRKAGADYAAQLKRTPGGAVTILTPRDDDDARLNGFPSLNAANQAIAIAISLLPDDAEVALAPRPRGVTAGMPALEDDIVIPTPTDRTVLDEMTFTNGRFHTQGNVNRRKYERLEDIGWLTHHCPSLSDVDYILTPAGRIQRALLATAAAVAADVPAPRGDFPNQVTARPRRFVPPRIAPGEKLGVDELGVTIDKVEGDVVTARNAEGDVLLLSAPPALLPSGR